VTNTGNTTGGLVGVFDGSSGQISQSFAQGNVTGANKTGGLVGQVYLRQIYNCYATGDVTATGTATGGLVGSLGNITAASINYCYSTGKVTGSAPIGGLLGELDGSGTISSSVWDVTTSTHSISAGGTGQTTSTMKAGSTFTALSWDFATIWTIQEGVSYPYFQWQGSGNIPY